MIPQIRLVGQSIPSLLRRCLGSCTFCKKPLAGLIACQECQRLQPVDKDCDPFELLSQPRRFNLSNTQLHRSYLALQQQTHPDLTGPGNGCDTLAAEGWSSVVNRAYSVLKDPLSRALALLNPRAEKLDGPEDLEDWGGSREAEGPKSLGFLEEMLELREFVENCDEVGRLRQLRETTNERIKELEEELQAAIDVKKDHSLAYQMYFKLKYLYTIIDAINKKE